MKLLLFRQLRKQRKYKILYENMTIIYHSWKDGQLIRDENSENKTLIARIALWHAWSNVAKTQIDHERAWAIRSNCISFPNNI